MTTRHEFGVIGGGLVGTAIGYGLARAGHDVVIVDEGDIAHRASRGNFGLVWVQGKGVGLPAYSNWTQLSARGWPGLARLLAEDTGIDVALEQRGGFHFCLSEREMIHRVDALTRLVAQPGIEPYRFEALDRAQVAERISGIGRDVVGATFTALDGHVNALKLLRALHAGFARHRGTYRPESRVQRIASAVAGTAHVADAAANVERYAANAPVDGAHPAHRAYRLDTTRGIVEVDNVVIAAGLGQSALAADVGLHVPVRPQRGQIIVLERVRRFLDYPISTLRQTDEGTILIGDSQEEAGFDDTTGTAVLATLADRAVRVFPALRDVRITRTWSALRVMSPDGFPVYAQSPSHQRAFAVTCHSGVTLAAAHVLELAPAIAQAAATGNLDARFAPFSADRFDVSKAA